MTPTKDIREAVNLFRNQKELKEVEGAHWSLEIGTLTELMYDADGPALLFDKVLDYSPGYRILSNSYTTLRRQLFLLGFPPDWSRDQGVAELEKKLAGYRPIKPVTVKNGPVMENVFVDGEVNLLKFPTPKWHELDGGRYLGTGCAVFLRDPEIEGWVNAGTYRICVYDERTLGLYITPNHHGGVIEKKYWDRGLSCPVAVDFGPSPMLYMAAAGRFINDYGVSEYDVAGYMQGEPIEVIMDRYTGLPIPARSEIVVVGEVPPPSVESRPEGPFGEWTGYYAHGQRNEPIIRVKALYHRNDPIILGEPTLFPKGDVGLWGGGNLKRQLEAAGIPDVIDAWLLFWPGIEVVKIKQRYPGHAAKAGLVATGNYMGRVVVVVDEDINIRDPWEVLWAIGTRCDPESSVEIVRGFQSSTLDPRIPPDRKAAGDFSSSRMIINACKPYHWLKEFPAVNRCSPELRREVYSKWKDLFRSFPVENLS